MSEIATKERKGGGGRRGHKYMTQINNAIRFSETKNGNNRKSLTFTIGIDIVKKYRLLIGDSVDVLFDADDRIALIRRVQTGGYTVCGSGIPASDVIEGKYYRSIVKCSRYDGMPSTDMSVFVTDIEITDDGIMFKFPDSVNM